MACDTLVRSKHEHINTHTHTNTHPHTVVVLADRWCMLKEIQAYPAQTATVGLARQQRAIGVLMQKLALFRPCNIHLRGQRAQILFAHWRHQYPLFYSAWHHPRANNRDRSGQTVMRWDGLNIWWLIALSKQDCESTAMLEAFWGRTVRLNANVSMIKVTS